MSLIKCKECGKEHSSSAKACPHCGYIRTSGCAKGVAWFFGIVILMAIWGSLQGDKTAQEAAQKERERLAALTPEQIDAEKKAKARDDRLSASRGACLNGLEQVLDNPSSAEFGSTRSWYIEERKDGSILVQPAFRAKNKFGALINTTWECVVRPEGTNVRVTSLKQISP